MPTLMRKASRVMQRLEPIALLFCYLSIGGMAVFAFIHPPSSSQAISHTDLIIEGVLLSIGSLLCLYGHVGKHEIGELLGLIFSVGGLYVLLYMCLKVFIEHQAFGVGQIIFLTFVAFGLIFSRIAKLQDSVSRQWLKPPSKMIKKIYNQ